MPVTNIKSKWDSGSLIFYNGATGAAVLTIATTGLTISNVDSMSASGTNSSSYTVDNDATTGKVTISAIAGAANKTLTLRNTALTDDRVITFPDATGTVALTTSLNLTAGADGTAGTCTIYPATASNGYFRLAAANSVGNFNLIVQNKAHLQSTTLAIPDCGAAAGQIPVINSDHSVIITAAADRTVTLGGNLSTAGAVTFSGAFAAQIAVPDASTWTLPAGGGTLAVSTGVETGTTSSSFTVDSDSAAAKIALNTNSATGDFTMSLVPANLTADRIVSFSDAPGTVMLLDNGGSQTAGGDFVITGTVDFRGALSASTGNPNVDLSASSGTFKTTTGTNTIYGNVASSGNITFSFAGSSGTFATSTGTNTLNGNTVVAGSKTFTTGTGAITMKGATTFDAGLDITFAGAGDGTFDLSTQTGIFKTSTGAVTIGGDTTISGAKTFATGTGAVGLNGDVTIANVKNLTNAAGGATTGYLQWLGKTSGGIKILPPDVGTSTITISMEAQTQGTSFKIPDLNVATAQFACVNSDHTVNITAAADAALTLPASCVFGGSFVSAGALDLGDHAITLNTGGATTLTLPATGTLATLAGSETLTGKVIDGDDNTIQDLGPAVPKAGTVGVRGGAVPIAGIPISIAFNMDNTAGSSTWTNATGKTFRITSFLVVKTDSIGGASDTVQLFNAGNAITSAISLTVADQVVAGPVHGVTTVNDAYNSIANAGTLVCTTVLGTDHCECEVTVTGLLT